jgi:hypothetical protein
MAEGDPVASLQVDAQFDAETTKLFNEKMALLFADYQIEQKYGHEDGFDRWQCLAKELAYAHVPGFWSEDATARRGAPKKWDFKSSGELVVAVMKAQIALSKQKGREPTIRDAIRRAIKDNPGKWPARGGGKMKPEDLQKRYNEAIKIVAAMPSLPSRRPLGALRALLQMAEKPK